MGTSPSVRTALVSFMKSLRHHIRLNLCSLLVVTGLLTASFHQLSHFIEPLADDDVHTADLAVHHHDGSVVVEHIECLTCDLAASLSAIELASQTAVAVDGFQTYVAGIVKPPEEDAPFRFEARGPPVSLG